MVGRGEMSQRSGPRDVLQRRSGGDGSLKPDKIGGQEEVRNAPGASLASVPGLRRFVLGRSNYLFCRSGGIGIRNPCERLSGK